MSFQNWKPKGPKTLSIGYIAATEYELWKKSLFNEVERCLYSKKNNELGDKTNTIFSTLGE